MKQFAYVGCRTTKERKARGKGIRIFEVEVWNIDIDLKEFVQER